ncbi:hypothetical protein G9A89_017279 [Geosiphon pyriformis]|nr:hypothetical protein G9A89_017279 [Geosiphon pyriformis]
MLCSDFDFENETTPPKKKTPTTISCNLKISVFGPISIINQVLHDLKFSLVTQQGHNFHQGNRQGRKVLLQIQTSSASPVVSSTSASSSNLAFKGRLYPTTSRANQVRTSDCIICTETYAISEFQRVTANCSHDKSICTGCVGRHIQHELKDKGNFKISCPNGNDCRNILSESDVQRFANEEDYKRYHKLSLNSVLSQMDDFRWCSNPQCDSGQIHWEGDAAPIMTCVECRQKSCVVHDLPIRAGSKCTECDETEEILSLAQELVHDYGIQLMLEKGHPEPKTDEEIQVFESFLEPLTKQLAMRLIEERKIITGQISRISEAERAEQLLRVRVEEETIAFIDSKTKRCPKCKSNIEKDGGCDHMTCRAPGCGFEFCWECLADFQPIRNDGNHRHGDKCRHYAPYDETETQSNF